MLSFAQQCRAVVGWRSDTVQRPKAVGSIKDQVTRGAKIIVTLHRPPGLND
jgi:hypothetical protein